MTTGTFVELLTLYSKAYTILDDFIKRNLEHIPKLEVENMPPRMKMIKVCSKVISDNEKFKSLFSELANIKDSEELVKILCEVFSDMYSYLKGSLMNLKFDKNFNFMQNKLMICINEELLHIPLKIDQ